MHAHVLCRIRGLNGSLLLIYGKQFFKTSNARKYLQTIDSCIHEFRS